MSEYERHHAEWRERPEDTPDDAEDSALIFFSEVTPHQLLKEEGMLTERFDYSFYHVVSSFVRIISNYIMRNRNCQFIERTQYVWLVVDTVSEVEQMQDEGLQDPDDGGIIETDAELRYDPSQPRGSDGKWRSSGGGTSANKPLDKSQEAQSTTQKLEHILFQQKGGIINDWFVWISV